MGTQIVFLRFLARSALQCWSRLTDWFVASLQTQDLLAVQPADQSHYIKYNRCSPNKKLCFHHIYISCIAAGWQKKMELCQNWVLVNVLRNRFEAVKSIFQEKKKWRNHRPVFTLCGEKCLLKGFGSSKWVFFKMSLFLPWHQNKDILALNERRRALLFSL